MNFNSQKTSVVVLAMTSVLLSRGMFCLFNDPEGPNLVVVMGMAAIIFFVSYALYTYSPLKKYDGLKKLLLTIVVQILLVTGLYFLL